MTDIEFDQIRPGQTVPRWVCDLVLGTGRGRALPADARITRVELLAEPDPGWRVGQLAEIDAAYSEDNKTVGRLVRWGRDRRLGGNCWVAVDDMDSVWDDSKVTRRVLLTVVPADARIVAQDAVVLPPGLFREWPNPNTLRRVADKIKAKGSNWGWKILHATADAIDEAQS